MTLVQPAVAAPPAPPAVVALRAGESFPLVRGDGVWRVAAGSTEWFKFDARPGSAYGGRVRLFAIAAGEIAVGGLPGIRASYQFDLVAAEPSRLEFVPFDATGDAGLMPAVERWIARVCRLLTDEAAPASALVLARDAMSIGAGDVVRPQPGAVAWLEVRSGGLAAFGEDPLPPTAADAIVPAAGELWFTAERATALHGHAPDALGGAALAGSLAAFLNLALRRFERLEDAARLREIGRLEDAQVRLQKLDAMPASLIGRALGANDRPEPTTEPLLAVLNAVGRETGIRFRLPREPAVGSPAERLAAIAQASGVRHRRVRLPDHWWKDDVGPLLAFAGAARTPVALLPGRLGGTGYRLFAPDVPPRPLTAADRAGLTDEGFMFFRPFPPQIDGLVPLGRFTFAAVVGETALMLAFSVVVSLLGLVSPVALREIVDAAIPDADRGLLRQLAACVAGVTFGAACFSLAQSLITLRSNIRLTLQLQAALIDRLLNLPAVFFRNYSSGDLLQRAMIVTQIASKIGAASITVVFGGFTAGLNIILLCYWSWQLALIPIAIALLAALVTFLVGIRIRRESVEHARRGGKLFGLLVQIVAGISKFRVAGAEPHALAQWSQRYAVQLGAASRIAQASNVGKLFAAAYTTVGTLLVYYGVMKLLGFGGGSTEPALSMGEFLGFNAAFGAFLAGVASLSLALVDIMDSFAERALCQPILATAPEANETKADPGRLRGDIEIKDVTFRYHQNGPYVLRGVSLAAHPGELVAIVGPSGCGKSTLFRLLLGFETPEAGAILYDQQELAGLNTLKVRQQIGTVLQTGTIGPGSMLECIASGTNLTPEAAWAALRDASLEDEVKAMPMQLQTRVNEDARNLSGGQRQRLMLARALAQNPKVLLLDEATSALDNRTQLKVSDALNRRQITRLVIAHRLSTIERADRIYVLQHGRIMQHGAYAELVAVPGLFQSLMKRQSL